MWEASPIGPFDHWPHPGGGFEYFYGFIGGETNQWYPAIYENTIAGRAVGHARGGLPLHGRHDRQGDRLDPPAEVARPGQAVLHLLRARRDARPAPRADGVGRQVRRASSTRAGTRCARRRSPGRRSSASIPQDAVLTERSPGIPAWDEMSDTIKPVARPRDGGVRRLPGVRRPPRRPAARRHRGARHPRRHAGLRDHRRQRRLAPRATMHRHHQRGLHDQPHERARDRGVHGRAHRRPRHARTRTTTTPSAGRTPWTRRTSGPSRSPRTGAAPATARSSAGPTASRPGARSATSSPTCIDVAPTVLEAAGIPEPPTVHGVTQRPMEGTAHELLASTTPTPPSGTTTQYFEMLGNRAIYHQGWTAVAKHKDPWLGSDHGLDDDVWELYNVEEDWTQSQRPRRRGARASWPSCSGCSSSRPPGSTCCRIDIRSAERFNPDIAGRPQLITGTTPDALPGHEAAQREHRRSTSRTSRYTVTAEVDGARRRRRRRDHRPGRRLRRLVASTPRTASSRTAYNLLGIETYIVALRHPAAGRRRRRCGSHFAYDGGGLGKGGTVTLFAGDDQDRRGPRRAHASRSVLDRRDRRRRQRPRLAGVDRLRRRPATSSPARIDWVRIDLGDDDHSHLIDPEHRLAVAMMKQ